jgi:WD40 repeat protein
MGKCRQVVESHGAIDAKDFARDTTNRRLISEVLDTKSEARNVIFLMKTAKLRGNCVATLAGRSDYVRSLAFHPTAPLLATGSCDKTAKLWRFSPDGSTATCVATLAGHGNSVEGVAFHPTAPLLATGSADKTAKLWR